jgi:hypothetical protein
LEIKLEENKDAMSFFDFSEEEALQVAEEEVIRTRERDGRICICGHPNTRHSTYADVVACNPTRMACDCKQIRLVLEVSDTRLFLRKTNGSGTSHALSKSMSKAKSLGVEIKWLIDPKCDRCNVEKPISPVSISQNGKHGYNAFLCVDCR